MGSRGAKYKELDREENRNYFTAGHVLDAEILKGKESCFHTLPEVSHRSEVKYIKLNPDGTFREMRIYENHKLRLEIAYHGEPLAKGDFILHVHEINGKPYKKHPPARRLTEEEFNKYRPYFIGLNLKRIKR